MALATVVRNEQPRRGNRDDQGRVVWGRSSRLLGLHRRSPQMILDERGFRDAIEGRTLRVGAEEYRLRLVGLSETPNNAVLLAIAVGGTDERIQLQLSDDLRRDPIALRQRVVYFAKRIVTSRQNGQ